MLERLTSTDTGEWTLITRAGRVEVEIGADGRIGWMVARDQIGSFAAVPSLSGDAVDWPLEVGAVPALRVERRGQLAGDADSWRARPSIAPSGPRLPRSGASCGSGHCRPTCRASGSVMAVWWSAGTSIPLTSCRARVPVDAAASSTWNGLTISMDGA